MKKVVMLSSLTIALAFGACNSSSNENNQSGEKAEYSCPMHPEVKSDKPGTCTKCGMDLEKVENKQGQMDSIVSH